MAFAYCIFRNVTLCAFKQNTYTEEEMKYLRGISKTPSLTNFAKKFAQNLRKVKHLCDVNKTPSLQTFRESLRNAGEKQISPERCWILD
jgi:pantothenate kinase